MSYTAVFFDGPREGEKLVLSFETRELVFPVMGSIAWDFEEGPPEITSMQVCRYRLAVRCGNSLIYRWHPD